MWVDFYWLVLFCHEKYDYIIGCLYIYANTGGVAERCRVSIRENKPRKEKIHGTSVSKKEEEEGRVYRVASN